MHGAMILLSRGCEIRAGGIYAGYLYYLWVLKTVVHIGMHHGFGLSGESDKTMYRKIKHS